MIDYERLDWLLESDTLELLNVAEELLGSGEGMANAIRYALDGKDPQGHILRASLAAWEASING